MKANIILISYLSSKSMIRYENFLKNYQISKFFASIFPEKKIFGTQIFQKKIMEPPKTNFQMILNTKMKIT